MDRNEEIEKIQEILVKSELDHGIPNSEIETRLDVLAKYSVHGQDAVRSVVNYFLKSSGLAPMKSFGPVGEAEDLTVADAKVKGKWANLRVKVTRLFEVENPKIGQSGIIGDDTDSISFVAWAKSNLPKMEEGKSYDLMNVVMDEYNGRFSAKLNKTSEIIEIEEDITAVQPEVRFEGAVVAIQNGSGLIKRCPICKKALKKGVCEEHGKVEGTYDLRIKAVVDNGVKAQEVLIKRELTESVIGITLDDAKVMAMEALDSEVVSALITSKLVGHYVAVMGMDMGRTILASSFGFLPSEITQAEIDKVIAEVA